MEAQGAKTVIERALVSFTGTSTANGNAGGTTVVCSALAARPDFDGQSILIDEGTYAGQIRDINGATTGGTVTVEPAFGGQIVSGINFHILTGIPSYAELVDIMGTGFDTATDSLVQIHDDLATHDTDIKADIGDFSGQTHLATLLAALGIPDVSGKSLYTCLITDRLDNATYGLSALETLVDGIESTLGTPARDLDTILGARWDSSGDLGTDIAQILTYTDILDNATNGLANIKSLIDTVDSVVDGIQTDLSNATDGLGALKAIMDTSGVLANARSTAYGRLVGVAQLSATTIDLDQAAATYDLFTGTTQAVIVESLVFRLPNVDVSDDVNITSISIQTDETTAQTIISAADGAKANLTAEAQLAYTGAIYIPTGAKIQLTIAGGAADATTTCNVVAKCRAVVAGGYLA